VSARFTPRQSEPSGSSFAAGLFAGRSRRDKLRQAEHRRALPGFAVDFVDPSPGRFFLRRRFGTIQGNFHFNAILRAPERNCATFRRIVALEAEPASRNDRILKLQNDVVIETSDVGQVARGPTHRRHQAVIMVHTDANHMRAIAHGYRSLARATSHASRQSGQ
jgi:hypothetical protein